MQEGQIIHGRALEALVVSMQFDYFYVASEDNLSTNDTPGA